MNSSIADQDNDMLAMIAHTLEVTWFVLFRTDAEGSFLGRTIRRTEVDYELTGDWKVVDMPINELGVQGAKGGRHPSDECEDQHGGREAEGERARVLSTACRKVDPHFP